jgi:hypothetical protein
MNLLSVTNNLDVFEWNCGEKRHLCEIPETQDQSSSSIGDPFTALHLTDRLYLSVLEHKPYTSIVQRELTLASER